MWFLYSNMGGLTQKEVPKHMTDASECALALYHLKYGYKRTMTRKSRSRTNSSSGKRIITVAHWSTFPSDEIVSGRTWRRTRMGRIMPSILEHNYR